MMCATTALVSLCVVLPVNSLQRLPLLVNLFVGLFGLFALFCYWRSRRGHNHIYLLYLAVLSLLDGIWFMNAGTEGSIAYYFFPALVYPMTVFRGRVRWLATLFVLVNLSGLIALEHLNVISITVFASRSDRTLDLLAGAFSASVTLVFVIWVVMENYDWEQGLITRYAKDLALSEKNYRDLIENARTAILRLDPQGRVTFINRYSEEIFGYRRKEIIGQYALGTLVPRASLTGEDQSAQFTEWLHHPETQTKNEGDNLRKDGSRLRISWTYRPLFDEKRRLQEILCVGVDVTERAALLDRLQMTQATMDAAAEQIIWLNREGRIIYVNLSALSALGYVREEILRLRVHDLMVDFSPAEWERHWLRLRIEKTLTFEALERRKDGSSLSVEVAATWMNVGGTEYLTSFIRDITDRKKAELALRQSEERFRQVVETISEVFWMIEVSSSRTIYVSPSFASIWGAHPATMEGVSQLWRESLHSNDRERVLAWMPHLAASAGSECVYRIVRQDGSIRWVRDRAFGFQDASGKVTHIVGVAEDITERRELEERLLHRQRLEAVGTLAGGVAHDLNNILTPMLMAGSMLKDRLPAPEDKELMSLIVSGAKRGSSIISQLLTFCRGAAGERLPVHPRELVREMAHIMRETFPRNILICEEAPPDVWLIDADATQLHQVLMNLCVNARDAMPEGGTLLLSVENVDQSGLEVLFHPEVKPGPYVVFKVVDSGHGIPPEIIDRIFDPFFTTKEVGKGTGLGLSTVHGIVKSHGGYVTVDSQPGLGASFRVHLPALGTNLLLGDQEGASANISGGGELIMVIDDEESIRASIKQVLERAGYEVVVASGGEEGLRLLQNGVMPGLIICDIMMPGMDGLEFARELRLQAPGVPLAGVSGIDHDQRSVEFAQFGFLEVLQKPFEPALLIDFVSRLLKSLAG